MKATRRRHARSDAPSLPDDPFISPPEGRTPKLLFVLYIGVIGAIRGLVFVFHLDHGFRG